MVMPHQVVRIKIDDVKDYHSVLLSKEHAYSKLDIEETPWGTIELTVIDPFSNRIVFYEERV